MSKIDVTFHSIHLSSYEFSNSRHRYTHNPPTLCALQINCGLIQILPSLPCLLWNGNFCFFGLHCVVFCGTLTFRLLYRCFFEEKNAIGLWIRSPFFLWKLVVLQRVRHADFLFTSPKFNIALMLMSIIHVCRPCVLCVSSWYDHGYPNATNLSTNKQTDTLY